MIHAIMIIVHLFCLLFCFPLLIATIPLHIILAVYGKGGDKAE